jgi:DNA-binding NtrC family response regulator
VTEGKFDEALYYRLAATPLHLPPLRARAREDVSTLVDALLVELSGEIMDAPATISPAGRDRLLAHSWPGNVRELRSVLERALLLARGADAVEPRHLAADVGVGEGTEAAAVGAPPPAPAGAEGAARSIADVERAHIERVLAAHGDNRTHAARVLGISRATLIKKIREYGLGARDAAPRTAGVSAG